MARVLVLGAHYDDVEIAVGGSLIQHHLNHDDIHIAVLFSDDNKAGMPSVREMEQVVVLGKLDATLWKFESTTPMSYIVKSLDSIGAEILYFPYELDTHQDHKYTSDVGFALARDSSHTVLKYVTVTSYNFYPNYFQVIDMEAKKKLVSHFTTQIERRPDYIRKMEMLNWFFGSLISGDNFAEGFIVHKIIKYKEGK